MMFGSNETGNIGHVIKDVVRPIMITFMLMFLVSVMKSHVWIINENISSKILFMGQISQYKEYYVLE